MDYKNVVIHLRTICFKRWIYKITNFKEETKQNLKQLTLSISTRCPLLLLKDRVQDSIML
jgi:hypothetical protein